MKIKAIYGVVALLLIFSVSCVKDTIDLKNLSHKINWNPKLGTPIAYGNLSLNNLIESIDSKEALREDSSHFLTLFYRNTLLSSPSTSIFKFNNQTFDEVLLESQYNLPPSPTQDTIVLQRNNNYPFDLSNGEIIDSTKLKSGTLAFSVSSTYKFKGTLKIVIPKLRKNHKPLEISVDINKDDGTFNSIQNIDLTGYLLELDHPGVTDNLLSFTYVAKLVNTGRGITAGDNLTIHTDFSDLNFSSIFGYLGQRQLLNIQSTFSIPVFRNISNPNLRFKNPILRIKSVNSFGVPAIAELYNSSAVNKKDNKSIPLTFSNALNPFSISKPNIPGSYKNDSIVFNGNSSNLNDALTICPTDVIYGIRCNSNPLGKTSNFVTDSSRITLETEMELPLDLKASNVAFTDTMDLDLSSLIKNTDIIKSLLLHSSFENGMPMDLNLQILLLDQNYQYVDTLFQPKIDNTIKSGAIDNNGKIISATKKDIDVQFSGSEIEKLKSVRYAIVKGGIVTTNGGSEFVRFYSNYTINVYFGIQTEIEVKEM